MKISDRKAKGLTLARKDHRCNLCFQQIEKGDLHGAHRVGPWNGTSEEAATVRHCRFCDECWDAETANWRRDDFEDVTCPSDILDEHIFKLQEEWGVREELLAIKEWERMTTAARNHIDEWGSRNAPPWVWEWLRKPAPSFNGARP